MSLMTEPKINEKSEMIIINKYYSHKPIIYCNIIYTNLYVIKYLS